MKQQISVDLAAARAAAGELVDRWFHQQSALRCGLLADVYAVKLRMARVALAVRPRAGVVMLSDYDPRLAGEAVERGVSVEVLARSIVARAAERETALLGLDDQRRAAKRELAAAGSEQTISAVAARFQTGVP